MSSIPLDGDTVRKLSSNCKWNGMFVATSSDSGGLLMCLQHDEGATFQFVVTAPVGYRLTTDQRFTQANELLSLGFVPVATTEPAQP